jgi:hypothetical protein
MDRSIFTSGPVIPADIRSKPQFLSFLQFGVILAAFPIPSRLFLTRIFAQRKFCCLPQPRLVVLAFHP